MRMEEKKKDKMANIRRQDKALWLRFHGGYKHRMIAGA